MRVLAIAAHPDDLELLCGGTLARFAREGHQVFMAHLTVGDKGGTQDPKELAATRRAEAAASAEVIGAIPLFGFTDDLELYDDREHRDLVMDFIRQAQPDLILAPDPNCYHADHRIASILVFNAAYCSTIPNYPSPSGLDAYPVRAPIYYMDTVNGVNFAPEEYVDITGFWETKRQMIECHASQLCWMKGHRGSDLVSMGETLSRVRGLQVQVEFAEAFRRENAWGRIRPHRLLP